MRFTSIDAVQETATHGVRVTRSRRYFERSEIPAGTQQSFNSCRCEEVDVDWADVVAFRQHDPTASPPPAPPSRSLTSR